MSLSAEGRIIYCDGAGCCASVPAPVALRPVRSMGSTEVPTPDAAGWLFVGQQGTDRHYCPNCVPHYLAQVTAHSQGNRRTTRKLLRETV